MFNFKERSGKDLLIQAKVDSELAKRLRLELEKRGVSLKEFFERSIELFLNEIDLAKNNKED